LREAIELLREARVPGERDITRRAPLDAAQSISGGVRHLATADMRLFLAPAVSRSDR
jgi:hypothetical protein